ncbi:N-acetyllactosaminide beta-1,3-N-acetylglucosaminyltransferase 2a [Symphorus nematophorus]
MFPNVPLYPGLVMQRGGNMPVARRKVSVLCVVMMLNVFVCILMVVSWNLRHNKSGRQKIRIPSERFWHEQVVSKSYWNKEQQRLDFIHNPLVNSLLSSDSLSELPDWLNDTGPLNPCEPDYGVRTQILDYNTLPQRFQDFLLYMRCRKYPMLIDQPHICDDKPFLLLVIKSLVPHFDRRQAIRETWGRAGVFANRTVATVFLLGNASSVDHFPDLLGMVGHEAELHKDLLIWGYRDTFFNLTLKEVLFLEWFSQNCPHAQYVLKGDDDVFVNTLRIIDFLEGLSENKGKDLFVGDVISNAGPHRNKKLKYFIPESVFEGQYPPYAGGGGYLYSGEVALRLHDVSRQVVLYPIDDVYTGMCLKKLGMTPEKHSGFKTFDIEEKNRSNPCIYRSLMLVHSRTPQDMLSIWPWIIHPELDCQ